MGKAKKRIFSGIKPSGDIHLGNYLGAITQFVKLQNEYDSVFCVVDYHAITVKQDPNKLRKRIIDIAKTYLAFGVDPKKSVIFQQSDIKEHTELGWMLNCIANAGELKRMTQFKDKTRIASLEKQKFALETTIKDAAKEFHPMLMRMVEPIMKEIVDKLQNRGEKDFDELLMLINSLLEKSGSETEKYYTDAIEKLLSVTVEENNKFNMANVGLYDYPVLMAADIILYDTDIVPVGEDQLQHVELTRTLARRFNNNFGETFKVPEFKINKDTARIMGLDDPEKKMSKSSTLEGNYIALADDPNVAAKKIMKAATDSETEVKYDRAKKPGISNLLVIYSHLANISIEKLEKKYEGKMYGEFKKDLAEIVKDFLTKFQDKFNKISDKEVRDILDDGAKRLQPIAKKNVDKAKKAMGVR